MNYDIKKTSKRNLQNDELVSNEIWHKEKLNQQGDFTTDASTVKLYWNGVRQRRPTLLSTKIGIRWNFNTERWRPPFQPLSEMEMREMAKPHWELLLESRQYRRRWGWVVVSFFGVRLLRRKATNFGDFIWVSILHFVFLFYCHVSRDLKSVNLPCFHSVIAKELMGCKEKKIRHVDCCAVFRWMDLYYF